VDVTLAVPRTTSFEEAHLVASKAEALIQHLLPRSDVMVHIDPIVDDEKEPGGDNQKRRRAVTA